MKAILKSILLLLTLLLMSWTDAIAGIEPPVTTQLTGVQFMNPFVTTQQTISSEILGFASGTNVFWGPTFDIKSIKNDVRLYIQPDALTFIDFGWELNVPVTIKVWQSNTPAFTTLPSVNLRITYDPITRTQFQQLEAFTFSDARRIEVSVNPATVSLTTDANTSQQKNAVAQVVALQSNITIERYDIFDYNFQHCPASLTHQYMPAENELKILWFAIPGAEEYQLEWIFIDNYDGAGGKIPSNLIPFSFEENAARVEIKANSYLIPLVYEQGYVIYRVRGIGRNRLNLDKPLVGKWSCGSSSCLYANCVSPTDLSLYAHKFEIGNSVGVSPYSNDKLNWQAITNYAEYGKSKTVVSSFDGQMKNRQSATGLSTDRQTLVVETVYDYQGRGAIQVLPAPVNTARLQFFPNFNRNQLGAPYGPLDFDMDPVNCTAPVGPMQNTNSGASNYYSPNNPDLSGTNALIPDAKEFPFTRTAFTPDNTGRVAWTSSPGEFHKPGSGHETKYFYGVPAQEELDPLFGNDVGFAKRHRKIMTIDPNGQGSLTYQNAEGETIATALCGNPPTGLDPLDSYQPVQMTIDLLAFNAVNTNDYSLVTQFTQLVNTQSDYVFTYSMTGKQYQDALCRPGNPICYDCIYDLEFKVIDNLNCGQVYYQNSQTIGKLLEDPNGNVMAIDQCGAVFTNNHTFTVPQLPVGSYTFYKKLSVNQTAADAYIYHWITDPDNTCVKTLQSFIDDELAKVDTSDCHLNCDDAVTASQEPGLSTQEIQDIQDIITFACDTLVTRCETAFRAMLADMKPGGQYGGTNPGDQDWALSVYNPVNSLPRNPGAHVYAAVPYLDAFGSPITLTGTPATDILTFTTNWNPEWAKQTVQFHPEFCMWDAYCPNQGAAGDMVNTSYLTTSDDYDAAFYETKTLQQAEALWPGISANPSLILLNDPFFSQANGTDTWNNFSNFKSQALAKMGVFAGTLSMLDLALRAVECPSDFSCTPTGFNATPAVADQQWLIFRSMYMGVKERFVYKSMSNYAKSNNCYNGCIGQDPFNPFLEDFLDPFNLTNGWWNNDQPCHWSTYWLYQNKSRRFPNVYDVVNTGNLDFYEDNPQDVIDAMADDIYPQVAGICDTCDWDINVATVLNWVWPYFVQSSGYGFQLSSIPGLSAGFVASMGGRPCTIRYDPNSSWPNSILLDLGGCLVAIQQPPASYSVTSFCCIQRITTPVIYTPYHPFYNYFHIDAISSSGAHLVLEGTYVRGCDGCDEDRYAACRPTVELLELKDLFNWLIAQNQLDPVGITNIPGSQIGSNIASSFGLGNSSLPWQGGVSGTTFLGTLSNPPARTCNLEMVLPFAGFPINNIQSILSIKPSGNSPSNSFVMEVLLNDGQKFNIQGRSCYYSSYCCDSTLTVGTQNGFGNVYNTSPVYPSTVCKDCPEITLIGGIANTGNDTTLFGAQCDTIWCDTTYKPYTLPIVNPCAEQLIQIALFNAQQQYEAYIDSLKAAKKEEYLLHCLKAVEAFSVVFMDARHHFTLYYYDQSNNLVKTVPPKGVIPITSTVQLTQVVNNRNGTGALATFPRHELRSFYSFTSLNQVYRQSMPDQNGFTNFWFDMLGRLIVSQNPRQRTSPKRYSYTRYDALNRIYESGEIVYSTGLSTGNPFILNTTSWNNALNSPLAQKNEVSRTWYDSPMPALYGWSPGVAQQRNLRGRVAAISFRERPIPYNQPNSVDHVSHYDYDIAGNVRTLWQDDRAFAVKKLEYEFDLITGNVNAVHYQAGQADQFHHYYEYDADNRLIRVQTSSDGYLKDEDGHYDYYKHGPLARTTLGSERVQGQDYAYTIQGWLKSVNSGGLQPQYDPGQDGLASSTNAQVARDAVGFTLGYFQQDYQPIGTGVGLEPGTNTLAGQFGNNSNLWNGNIRSMITAIKPLMPTGIPQAYAYTYDQLNRLTLAQAHNSGYSAASNEWTGTTETQWYRNEFKYDANGNITYQQRNGNPAFSGIGSLKMDQLTYVYNNGRNQLNRVKEHASVLPNAYTNDVDGQSPNNYRYDATGNLICDKAEDLDIRWTATGKVRDIRKNNAQLLRFRYDAMGQRLSKRGNQYTQFNVYDASGKVMATYNRRNQPGPGYLTWTSANIYGSSRLGEYRAEKCLDPGCLPPSNGYLRRIRGQRKFELGNHLQNVLATITDRKLPVAGTAPNLVILNQDFSSGTGGWGPNAAGVLTNNAGSLRISGTNANDGGAVQLPTLPGQSYILTFDLNYGSSLGNLTVILVKKVGGSYQNVNQSFFPNGNTITFTATDESYLNITLSTPGAQFFQLDNLILTQTGLAAGLVTDHFEADVWTASDYYPFGMEMVGRTMASGDFRYGYQNWEKDDEIKGSGNHLSFGDYGYDPRLGRRWNIDPIASKYPDLSPYHFTGNNPIRFVDFDGEDFGVKINHTDKTIVIVANVYTTSDKSYRQALKSAGAWNTKSATSGGYTVTFQMKVNKPVTVSESEVVGAFGTVDFYRKNGKLNKNLYSKYESVLVKNKTLEAAESDPIGNSYAGNNGLNSRNVSGSTFTGGQTMNGRHADMNTHDERGDMGESEGPVTHEFGHFFGLDDKGGTYYPGDGGIMQYTWPMNSISDGDVNAILNYTKDYLGGKVSGSTVSKVTLLENTGSSDGSNPIGVSNNLNDE